MHSSKNKKWTYPMLVMIVIFIISSFHGSTVDYIGLGNEIYHVRGHFLLFSALTLAFFKATKQILFSILLTAIYAVFDEIHQYFVPGRAFQVFDIYVDILGAVIMGFILWKLKFVLPKKLKYWLIN